MSLSFSLKKNARGREGDKEGGKRRVGERERAYRKCKPLCSNSYSTIPVDLTLVRRISCSDGTYLLSPILSRLSKQLQGEGKRTSNNELNMSFQRNHKILGVSQVPLLPLFMMGFCSLSQQQQKGKPRQSGRALILLPALSQLHQKGSCFQAKSSINILQYKQSLLKQYLHVWYHLVGCHEQPPRKPKLLPC